MNNDHPPITDAGGVPIPPTPFQQLVMDIGPAVQEWFMERFNKPIAVECTVTAEGVRYKLRHARPGLMPTAIEQAAFDAFILGYRAAGSRAHDLFVAPGEVN
jgi:hypothetical protein